MSTIPAGELGAVMDQASGGNPDARARLELHFRTLYPEKGTDPFASPAPPPGYGSAPAGPGVGHDRATTDPDQAKAEIARLGGDRQFMARLDRGEAAALERWAGLHRTAHPEPGSRDARAALAQAKADPAFMAKVMSGDRAAMAEWDRLHQAAHPEPGEPLDPRGYALPPAPGMELDRELATQAATAFTAAGIGYEDGRALASAWNAAVGRVVPVPPELAVEALVQQLGPEGADRLVATAQDLVRELDRGAWPGLRDLLDASGVANDPELIMAVGRVALARAARR